MSTGNKKTVTRKAKDIESDVVEPRRLYKGEEVVTTDHFKLESASFLKDVGFDPKRPTYEKAEHCHFFHTYNSRGKQQFVSNSVGGHCHKLEIEMDEQGNLVGVCSPPMVNVSQRKEFVARDKHIHPVKYLRSERIQVQKINQEAARVFDAWDQIPKD